MKPEQFDDLANVVLQECLVILRDKGKEHTNIGDRLDQFVTGSLLTSQPPHQILRGLMIKQTVTIYKMLKAEKTKDYPLEMWRKKIFAHINYLILLYALIVEENEIMGTGPNKPVPDINIRPDRFFESQEVRPSTYDSVKKER